MKYSYFQLTFGQQEAYLEPRKSYERLKRFGYDAIEICPPKGRYGLGVSIENYLKQHKELKEEFGLEVSNVNECWGEMWDPFSPVYKTLTEQKTADLAVTETSSTIDFAAELGVNLTLAGHTHGGQIGVGGRSFFDWVLPYKYLWGHYTKDNGSQLYTSAGIGHWFPFRLGCPAEAPVFVLRRGEG
ncbi:MAG: hypothetical protein DRP60_11930 [Spirochaetes bacterium]|nr:MAG: hypothetical protein DRP60_11930 [Spirochaetota bacterium]